MGSRVTSDWTDMLVNEPQQTGCTRHTFATLATMVTADNRIQLQDHFVQPADMLQPGYILALVQSLLRPFFRWMLCKPLDVTYVMHIRLMRSEARTSVQVYAQARTSIRIKYVCKSSWM